MSTTSHGTEWPRRFARSLTAAVIGLLMATGCQQEITNPSIITPDNLTGKDALPTIRDAALGDFALSYSGSGADGSAGTEGIIMISGLLSDEFINSETFPTRIEVDRRSIQTNNGNVTGWFRTIQRARRSTEFAARRYRALAPDTTKETGFPEMLALNGFTYLFLAENFCSGVPISSANDDGTLTFGQPQTRLNLLDSAISRFTQAQAAATALAGVSATTRSSDINLATVGLGRALLDKAATPAEIQAAAAAVAAVPTSFAYVIFHSSNSGRQNNGVFVAMQIAKRYAVADSEGGAGVGLRFRTQGDLRVPIAQAGKGFDGATNQWNQMRFTDRPNPNPLATGAEARLIEAEAFLAAGDTVNFLLRHNALRAAPPAYFNPPAPGTPITGCPPAAVTAGCLAPLTTVGLTSPQVQDLQFHERAFWLWISGHRLGDLRREARAPYNRPTTGAGSVFPTGSYFKGGVYGTDVNFPVPFDETNNPNFTQCLDRNP